MLLAPPPPPTPTDLAVVYPRRSPGTPGVSNVTGVNVFPARSPRQVEHTLVSVALGRAVRVSIVLPPYYRLNVLQRYPLVVFNDGQDFAALRMRERLDMHYRWPGATPRIIVGVHADANRMSEYGTAQVPDYAGRGDRAAEYSRFITTELLPWLKANFRVSRRREDLALAGFSLGGLSAFDIALRNGHNFGAVACFSASFWWRSAPMREEAPDADRVAVDLVEGAARVPDLRYYFMAGDREEESDRNGNGVIDVIDDTRAVIDALRAKGVPERAIAFALVPGGEHDQVTWGPAVITWLRWLDSQR